MSEWQPIESAPLKEMDCAPAFLVSDGKKVWVATVMEFGGRFEFTDELSDDHELYGKEQIRAKLTHWMPLPGSPRPSK